VQRRSSPISWLRTVIGWFADAANELFPTIVTGDVAAAEADGWHIDAAEGYCPRCGASVGPGEVTPRGCSRCAQQRLAWDRLIRLTAYKPPMAAWIVAMKFHKQWSWGPWLGRQLAQASRPVESPETTIVCHVPMPRIRQWLRGFSQARLMAEAFAQARGMRSTRLLRRHRWQPPQMSMHLSQRAANVRDAFRIAPVDLTGWTVWLIDDVKTSGATLTACAKLLREAGAEQINVAVAAVADPKRADFKVN
jgi:ComF family protein